MAKLLAIGNGTVDVLVKPINELDFEIDSHQLDSLVMSTGGDTMNVTVNMTRLGMDVDMMALVSDDTFGKTLTNRLEQVGAGTKRIKVVPGSKGSVTLVVINDAGDRTFYSLNGAINKTISEEDIDFDCFGEYEFLLYNNAFVLPNLLGKTAERIFKTAKEAGCITASDVSWDRAGKWLSDEGLGLALPYIDYFMPSYVEAKAMTGSDNVEEMARVMLEKGAKNVVIKLGGDGCYFANAQESFYTGAYAIEAIDTTGAGDAFISGFMTGLMKGMSHKECCHLASAMGSNACTFIGTTTQSPTYEEICAFMETAPQKQL